MRRQRITPGDIFLAFLAVLLISVSFYQTWLGLEQIFGDASLIIALVLSLLLLFLCWMIREAKLKGESTGKLMGIYTFIAIFCFMANFNALYTRFMRTDIYETEVRKIDDSFNKLNTDVNAKLGYTYDATTRRKIDNLKDQLKAQINDKGNPGLEQKSMTIIEDIEKLMSKDGERVKIDILRVHGDDYEDLAERMGQQIDNLASKLPPDETKLKEDLAKANTQWDKEVQEYLALSKEEKDEKSQVLINKAVKEYNSLGNRAHTLLGEKYSFKPFDSATQQIGKIGYAFSHAIENFGIYQLVVLLGCILLDFIIPIILLFVTKPDEKGNAGSGVFKKGKVLIPNR